jgi:dihydropteroate synthase type 2
MAANLRARGGRRTDLSGSCCHVAVARDIRGFPDRDRYDELAEADCRLIVMHSIQHGPATRIATDPGLGYFLGSTPEPSLVALAGIRWLEDRDVAALRDALTVRSAIAAWG